MNRLLVLLEVVGLLPFYLALCKGAELNAFISHYETLQLEPYHLVTTDTKMSSRFHFKAHGRDFKLHLETHPTIFHPDFHVIAVGKEGRIEKKRIDTRHIVTGYVEGEVGSVVNGHIHDGAFDGVIHLEGESYHIEPSTAYPSGSGDKHNRIIYKMSDVNDEMLRNSTCFGTLSPRHRYIQESAIPTNRLLHQAFLRRKRAVDQDLNTCILRVVADNRFFTQVGNGQESNTVGEMTTHIMEADRIYRQTTFLGRNGEEITGFGVSIQSTVIYENENSDPFKGDFSVDELLEAFSELNFDDVCLGHLFTYRDFQGTIGLAYLGDENGQLAGGICQQRTQTAVGERNLNTGLTSLLNFGFKLPRAVSITTVAHELGHNHGSPHDPAGPCSPGGSEGNFIMFASATNGNRQEFSPCSQESIGRTIEVRGGCFVKRPSTQQCGNGIIEGDEECDCGSMDPAACFEVDPCCTTNCTLDRSNPSVICSPMASSCCTIECIASDAGKVCLRGDTETGQGGCQQDSQCDGTSPECPEPQRSPDGSPCNDGNNACVDGACTGSPCVLYEAQDCFCMAEEQLCDVCCVFDGQCISTFDREGVKNISVQPGYPCGNFSGYCTDDNTCKRVDNDNPLDNLRDILLNFTSIVEWIKGNWYWVLAGFGGLIILIILLQITYRRKKLPTESTDSQQSSEGKRKWWKRRRKNNESYGYFQRTRTVTEVEEPQHQAARETSSLLRPART